MTRPQAFRPASIHTVVSDRQGGNGDAQQVPLVMALIEAGFVDKLLFSADAWRSCRSGRARVRRRTDR